MRTLLIIFAQKPQCLGYVSSEIILTAFLCSYLRTMVSECDRALLAMVAPESSVLVALLAPDVSLWSEQEASQETQCKAGSSPYKLVQPLPSLFHSHRTH